MSRASMAASFSDAMTPSMALVLASRAWRPLRRTHHPHGDNGEVRRHAHFTMAGKGNAADHFVIVCEGRGEKGGGKGQRAGGEKGLEHFKSAPDEFPALMWRRIAALECVTLRDWRRLAGNLRQGRVETGPVRGSIGPDRHLRLQEIRIVKGAGADEDQVRPGFGLAEQRCSAFGQKPRCMRFPLSATLSCQMTLPCSEKESERKHTLTMPFPRLDIGRGGTNTPARQGECPIPKTVLPCTGIRRMLP